jgi:dihydroneopterin aldolase
MSARRPVDTYNLLAGDTDQIESCSCYVEAAEMMTKWVEGQSEYWVGTLVIEKGHVLNQVVRIQRSALVPAALGRLRT